MSSPRAPVRVLVIDDEAQVRAAYSEVLGSGGTSRPHLDSMEAALFGAPSAPRSDVGPEVELDAASQGAEGHALVVAALAAGRPYSVVFIDMRMPPGWDGLRTAEHIRAADPQTQIVIATAYSDHAWNEVVRRVGHVESLFLLKKPFDPVEVRQLVSALGEKWRLTRAADRDLAEMKRLTARLGSTVEDLEREVTTRRSAEEALHRHAYFDALTGLPNRLNLIQSLEVSLARRRRDPAHSFAVLFFDLDGFKLVNDSLGHDMGDQVLAAIANRLSSGLRELDAVARTERAAASRLGGDEFVVVLEDIRSHTDAAVVAERLLRRISLPIDLVVQQVALSASVGIAVADARHTTAEDVLRDADTAMYRAKSERLPIAMYDPAMQEAARLRLSIESDLRRAVEGRHFSVVFQPIVHAGSRQIAAIEALVRWDHPDYPKRSPAEFIPVAEQTGLIVPLGRWILEEACAALAALRAQSPQVSAVRVSVNVSRRQLLDPRFPSDVRDILKRTGVPSDCLDLEITESAIIGDEIAALGRLAELKQIGVGIHLDDFGTGYSALSCLQNFPLDVVKIDRTFVQKLGDSGESFAIVEAIVMLAHRLGMCVTVEGIETDPQMKVIAALGSDFAQGFLLGRPLDLATLSRMFAAQHPGCRESPVESSA